MTIRLGLLRLCDAAPLILAVETGIAAAHGLDVALSVEPSWANLADKLSYGLLDGAVMLPPLALACAAGLRGRRTALAVPMSLSANGNTVTLAAELAEAFAAGGIAGIIARRRIRLAVVHMFSTHDLLLRYWLAASGVDPARDMEITVLPPAEMVSSLAAGAIDGFCAGAPWGEVAAHAGLGFTAIRSAAIWADHPEKCLSLRADFVAGDPAGTAALIKSVMQAAPLCRGAGVAALLAAPDYLDVPAALIARAMESARGGPDFSQQYPDPAHAAWFAGQLQRWGHAPPGAFEGVSLYRPDLFLAAGGAIPSRPPEQFFPAR
jgi:NitT/TauT family transport system ATP-binding protein/nitrate/nitrite transport system substrate-binding protein